MSTYVLPAIFLHQMKLKFRCPGSCQSPCHAHRSRLSISWRKSGRKASAIRGEAINKKYIYPGICPPFSLRFSLMKFLMLHCRSIRGKISGESSQNICSFPFHDNIHISGKISVPSIGDFRSINMARHWSMMIALPSIFPGFLFILISGLGGGKWIWNPNISIHTRYYLLGICDDVFIFIALGRDLFLLPSYYAYRYDNKYSSPEKRQNAGDAQVKTLLMRAISTGFKYFLSPN